ncbi:hypothetical protein ACFWBG_00245 [Nocardia salmonicida]|uniref:hypothetical protein n=1 Tax=Nocardia salmonicida TaxID=53431 RepID=UPI00366FB029
MLNGICGSDTHLRGAIVAARGRRLDVALDHIAEARALARPMTRESDLYTTDFGPGNVEVHACAVELEAGDPGKAAHDGAALILPVDMAAPRAGHHRQDNARTCQSESLLGFAHWLGATL